MIAVKNNELIIKNREKLGEFLHTSPKKYFLSKKKFEDDCENMLEFLRWYNIVDCRLLTECIKKYAKGFRDEWNINIHLFKSVSIFKIFLKAYL